MGITASLVAPVQLAVLPYGPKHQILQSAYGHRLEELMQGLEDILGADYDP